MKEKLKLCLCIVIAILLIAGIGVIVSRGVKQSKEEVKNPVASFEIQDYGTVKMELYPEYAPNTVANFIALIQAGFYNNKMIYGKDKLCLYMARDTDENAKGPKVSLIDDSVEADSENDYEYSIDGEFIANGFEKNTLRHEKGVISFNRYDYTSYGLTEESYNSGNYRFSVMMDNNADLNGVYAAFGRVTEGLDILENIYNNVEIKSDKEENATEGNTETAETTEETTSEVTEEKAEDEDAIKEFATMPVITNATVETYDVNYEKPKVHEAFDIQSYINNLYSQYFST